MLGILIFGTIFSWASGPDNYELYHIVSLKDWESNVDKGKYTPSSVFKEGFIHLSTKQQIVPIANSHFKGKSNLLLLRLSIPKSDPLLKWDEVPSENLGLFAHYYGGLPLKLIAEVHDFTAKPNGEFEMPYSINQGEKVSIHFKSFKGLLALAEEKPEPADPPRTCIEDNGYCYPDGLPCCNGECVYEGSNYVSWSCEED